MSSLDTLKNDGFTLTERRKLLDDGSRRKSPSDTALFSLKLALQAYFSTYQPMHFKLDIFDPASGSPINTQELIDLNHPYYYCELCTETIVHFQHFAELICKDFLRQEHPLLANNVVNKPIIAFLNDLWNIKNTKLIC